MIPSASTMPPKTVFSIFDYNLTELKFEDVSDSNGENSSMIWVILFSILMLVSILSNTIYILTLRTKSVTTTHIIIITFFIINLFDYCLMMFEFSLGSDNHFPYSDRSCTLYQLLNQISPLLTAVSLLYLVLHALGLRFLTPGSSSVKVTAVMTVFLIMLSLIPVTMFSEVAIYPSKARFCVTDLSSVGISLGHDIYTQHIVTAVYNIMYKSVFVFWLPVMMIVVPVIRMMKMINTDNDKNMQISLSVAVAISFVVFNLPLATVAAVRYDQHSFKQPVISKSYKHPLQVEVLIKFSI